MFGACITIQLLDLKLEGSCALAMGILPGRSQPLDENGFSTRRTGWSWHNEHAFRNPSCRMLLEVCFDDILRDHALCVEEGAIE